MPRATLTVTLPERIWIGGISRSHPDARLRILSAIADDDTGVGLVEVHDADVEAVVADLRDSETVTDLEVLQRTDDVALVQFETTIPLLLRALQSSGVPIPMPFTIEDGEAEWEITAPRERLSALASALESFGIPYDVQEIHQRVEPESLLTERQLRLLEAAVERGYYDTPRECSLTELAESRDLAKSTCSETLHRAEEAVVKHYLENVDRIESPHP